MATVTKRCTVVTPANGVSGPVQGHWTYNSYATLPDDGQRYEIVDGVLFMTPAPNIPHQKVAQRLFRYLAALVEDADLGQVFIAPVDVELSPQVVVQPNLIVILNANIQKITSSRVVGAPDLVVEVSSPATVGYDRRAKQDAYAHAGIPEYWIAHPGEQMVEALVLEGNAYQSLGIFRGQATLYSTIVPTIAEIPVEKFFVYS